MKVIARTNHGYLVETTDEELCHAAGYVSLASLPGARRVDAYYTWEIPIGTIIHPTLTHTYLQKLRDHEAKCKSSAAFLRGMADMIDSSLPTTIIPPE